MQTIAEMEANIDFLVISQESSFDWRGVYNRLLI